MLIECDSSEEGDVDMAVRREKSDQRQQAAQEQGEPPLDVEQQNPTHAEHPPLGQQYICTRETGKHLYGGHAAKVLTRNRTSSPQIRQQLQRVPKAHQGMVSAALRSVFTQEKASEIEARWDDLASSLAERFPRAAELMLEAREDVLSFRHFPEQHRRKIWSTNLLERVNEEIKRRTRVVGIIPNHAAITRLVGAVLLEQDEHWQLEGRRMFSAESMAAIPALEELPAQPSLQEATA